MLKNFMQPGSPNSTSSSSSPSGSARADSTRSASAYESTKLVEPSKVIERENAEEQARSDAGSKLIVGPNIKLKGSEITDCEILVVEGRVEASMNSRDIRIAMGGVFSGKADIDVAEVRGTFEGELTARKRLVVYATGRVTGVIRYGALMVEEGGIVSGDVAATAGTSASVTPASRPSSEQEARPPQLEEIRSNAGLARTLSAKR